MTSSKISKIDPIAVAKAELADAKAQRDLAQQNFNAAQAQIQQGQQKAAEAQQMVLIASGAVQQCEAFLKKLEPEGAALAAVPEAKP
jgi:hypothetical protein